MHPRKDALRLWEAAAHKKETNERIYYGKSFDIEVDIDLRNSGYRANRRRKYYSSTDLAYHPTAHPKPSLIYNPT